MQSWDGWHDGRVVYLEVAELQQLRELVEIRSLVLLVFAVLLIGGLVQQVV
jgi:hypothetical protein